MQHFIYRSNVHSPVTLNRDWYTEHVANNNN